MSTFCTLSTGGESVFLLRMMFDFGFVKYSPTPITLKSGRESHVYVFGREDITDNPRFLYALGYKVRDAARLIFEKLTLVNDSRIPCLIGLPTAGTPLAQAASMVSFLEKRYNIRGVANTSERMCFRIMRE